MVSSSLTLRFADEEDSTTNANCVVGQGQVAQVEKLIVATAAELFNEDIFECERF